MKGRSVQLTKYKSPCDGHGSNSNFAATAAVADAATLVLSDSPQQVSFSDKPAAVMAIPSLKASAASYCSENSISSADVPFDSSHITTLTTLKYCVDQVESLSKCPL